MNNTLIAQASITVNAPIDQVWDALINPEKIKQYLFGTQAISDWKKGSSLLYKGVWEGKEYEDKGTILEIIPEKKLVTTYWSSASGIPDLPENYKTVTYEVEPDGNGTKVTITQDNNSNEEAKKHSEGNWNTVLQGLKKLLEA